MIVWERWHGACHRKRGVKVTVWMCDSLPYAGALPLSPFPFWAAPSFRTVVVTGPRPVGRLGGPWSSPGATVVPPVMVCVLVLLLGAVRPVAPVPSDRHAAENTLVMAMEVSR